MADPPRFAAFLRGMNVGGHRLSNEELRGHFSAMGFREVASFRASGNVIFSADPEPPRAIAERIEQGLEASLGYAVPTFIRASAEVREIAAAQPFAPEHVRASTGKLHVGLLTAPPSAGALQDVLSLGSDRERLAFGERELYWLPAGRTMDSELDLKAVERLLGPMTLRTKSTIELICARHFAE
jgi:uncharacterized protein (DUF1697 family)